MKPSSREQIDTFKRFPCADVIGNAVRVMQIATGEAEEEFDENGKNRAAVELGRKGGRARANKLTAEQRFEIAKMAAAKRWGKG